MRKDLYGYFDDNIEHFVEAAKNDADFLHRLYGSLCNTDWIKGCSDKEEFISCLKGENVFAMSWRAAGAVCADIYNQAFPEKEQHDYMDYYCSGNEGKVFEDISEFVAQFGWKIVAMPVSP